MECWHSPIAMYAAQDNMYGGQRSMEYRAMPCVYGGGRPQNDVVKDRAVRRISERTDVRGTQRKTGMKKGMREERGAVFVEASIVFPVCLIVILMLLYLGNVYYQKSRIEAIVVEAALDGAAYCADPLLRAIESGGGRVPALGSADYEPYRYLGGLFGGMDSIEESVSSLITDRVRGMNTGLFSGMKPTGYDTGGLQVEYRSSFIASSISVDMEYRIELPIRLLGDRENLSMKFRTHTEVPVGDTPEFIRNVNMVDDIFEVTGAKEAMTNKIQELRSFVRDLFHR